MKDQLIVSHKDMTICDALDLMKKHRIRHLPIVNDSNEIIGIVSDRDLRDASPSIFDDQHKQFINLPVSKVMIDDVITAMPRDFVEEAANIMVEQQISCLPVEEDDILVGIITETDLLNTLVKLTGADLPTSRLEIEVSNESGQLSDVSNIIKEHKINIQSVLVYPSFHDPSRKILVFRIQSIDLRPLLKTLKQRNYQIIWPTELEMKT
ncbi:phage tail protein [Salipaludibacillus keqinensis]|uniref:Phage tail protein n=1 Tax=Salipaludibacillus keqinensis TaxID=2045207 RepID=A0A323TJ03_9BACI|nr:CBS and ACT domain-containing protein [Salipaludibacillus keqinensis]PYZ93964.1 phage tail protein [Salipaludibacillus keqinensis]